MEPILTSIKPFDKNKYQDKLKTFIGTENYYNIGFGMKCTDGVKYVADALDFPGILDLLAMFSVSVEFKETRLRVFKFTSNPENNNLNLDFQDGNYNVILKYKIELSTRIPVYEVEIWSEHDVFYLPSEH